jgi:hypothetical protein
MPGIFDSVAQLYAIYSVELQFRNKIMGGTPLNPKLIEGWLRTKAGIKDSEEIRQAMLRTLMELGADVDQTMSFDQVMKASEQLAGQKQTTGFKRDPLGLYIEDRQVKAGLREWVNILYADTRVGATFKGAKNYVAERVFIDGVTNPDYPDRLHLIDPETDLPFMEPTDVEMMIGHVTGPQGPRSTLGYHEYVERAVLRFNIKVAQDCIPAEWWPQLLVLGQENGLGAARSQSYGRFDVLKFDRVVDSGHKRVAQVKQVRGKADADPQASTNGVAHGELAPA